jgi:phytoene synthase
VLYARVGAGVALLPPACRPGINAARFLYAAIGHEVARRGMDSVSQRAVVGRGRKLGLLALALLSIRPSRATQPAPCLAANRFLVDAAALHNPVPARQAASPAHGAWWRLDARLSARAVWVIDLFERLERRDEMARAANGT